VMPSSHRQTDLQGTHGAPPPAGLPRAAIPKRAGKRELAAVGTARALHGGPRLQRREGGREGGEVERRRPRSARGCPRGTSHERCVFFRGPAGPFG
jgi:hypothetical protein